MSKFIYFRVEFRKPPEKGYYSLVDDFEDIATARRWAKTLREQGKKHIRIRRTVMTTRTVW